MQLNTFLKYSFRLFIYLFFSITICSAQQPEAVHSSIAEKLSKASHDTLKANILLEAGNSIMQTDNAQALAYFEKALSLSSSYSNHQLTVSIHNQLGTAYSNQGYSNKALNHFQQALNLGKEHNIKDQLVVTFNNIGKAYFQQDKYSEALQYYFKSLALAEKLTDSTGITHTLNNIAIIYSYQGNQHKALAYFQKSLQLRTMLHDKRAMAASYSNIANIYDELQNETEALDYYLKALKIFEELKDLQGLARVYNNLGHVSDKLHEPVKAQLYYKSAYDLFSQFGDLKGQALACSNLGESYMNSHQLEAAQQYLQKGFSIAKNINSKEILLELYLHFSKLFHSKRDFENAYQYQVLYSALKDSVFNETSSNQIAEMAVKYEAESKEKEIQLLNTERELQNAEISQQKLVRNFLVASVFMALMLSFVLYRSNRIRHSNNKELKKLNQAIFLQNEEITAQRDNLEMLNEELNRNKQEITRQHEDISKKNETLKLAFQEIARKNDSIMASLQYAQRIQGTIMAAYTKLQDKLPEHFIFFQPREIVSGDFYWFAEKDNLLFIAVIDCTGHGVPGAIMSMVGGLVLDQIISEKNITNPGQILSELHKGINKALSQEESGSRDGMDAGLCVLDRKTNMLSYAGAKIPLYYIQQQELHCIPGGRYSLGGKHTANNCNFQTHHIKVDADTAIYLFTDGYQDQFGGPWGKKFMIKQLRELIHSIHHLPMDQQKEILVSQFSSWKGNQDQVDDILIAGFKLKQALLPAG